MTALRPWLRDFGQQTEVHLGAMGRCHRIAVSQDRTYAGQSCTFAEHACGGGMSQDMRTIDERSIITFGPGAGRGSGSESMTPCANGCGRRLDETANPAARRWTASQCEP